MEKGHAAKHKDYEESQPLLPVTEYIGRNIFDKPLPCFGCGIGWFSFLLGLVFPVMWYYATILYFSNYYRKDPRERAGLAACAIAALICSVAILITLAAIFL